MDFLYSYIRKFRAPTSEFNSDVQKMKCDSEVKISIEKHFYTWILHDFFKVIVPKYDKSCFTSPAFGRNGSKYQWQIVCRPNGIKANCVSFYLSSLTPCAFAVLYTFDFRNSDDETLFVNTSKAIFTNDKEYPVFKERNNANTINLKDDVLKIHSVISIEIVPNENSLLQYPHLKLAADLKTALKDKIDTDFVLKVEDFELPVHKVIIAARCPVFYSMLDNNTVNNREGCLHINDMDKDTLILLINFIYTGKVTEMSYNEAAKLFSAANKYLLFDLEKACEDELLEKLKLSNVSDILILAELHNAMNLKAEVMNFIVQNHWKFVNNALLEKVAEKSPKLLLEVISKLTEAIPYVTKTF